MLLRDLFLLFLGVAALNHLVVLKASETLELFMKYDLSVPKTHRARDFIGRQFSIGNFHGFVGNFLENVLKRLKRCPMVAEITPDIEIHAFDLVQQDNPPTHLAHLSSRDKRVTGYASQPYYYDSDESGQNVNVYIVDSGLALGHEEFEERAFFGKDFTHEGSGDTNGHGTHVGGIVGSATYGVAKKARLFEVKTLDKHGQGSLSGILAAMEFVVKHRRRAKVPGVVNLLLGAAKNSILNRAVDAAAATGMVVVVAAGNTNEDACRTSPASARGAITVGAVDELTMALAEFLNWGACVDLYASGVEVSSVDPKSSEPQVLTGTSMAAPAVAGLAASLLSAGISPYHVKAELVALAVDAMVPLGKARNRVLYNGMDPESEGEGDEEGSEGEGEEEELGFWRGPRWWWGRGLE